MYIQSQGQKKSEAEQMELSNEEQTGWALSLSLVIIVVAGIFLFPPAETSKGVSSAAPEGGLTELVLGVGTFLLGAAAS